MFLVNSKLFLNWKLTKGDIILQLIITGMTLIYKNFKWCVWGWRDSSKGKESPCQARMRTWLIIPSIHVKLQMWQHAFVIPVLRSGNRSILEDQWLINLTNWWAPISGAPASKDKVGLSTYCSLKTYSLIPELCPTNPPFVWGPPIKSKNALLRANGDNHRKP